MDVASYYVPRFIIMTIENPYDALHTVNLVTQCLSIPIVTLFVALRFSIRVWYKQFVIVEDSMPSNLN